MLLREPSDGQSEQNNCDTSVHFYALIFTTLPSYKIYNTNTTTFIHIHHQK